jgi:Fur family peroxide stress response transcriptional regulator
MAGQRFSYQRQRIYDAVGAAHHHPTAEMVYAQLKPSLPRLSLGTVYRNLHQMAQAGLLAELPGPVARFDAATQPHTHFVCERCGAVLDLPMPYDAGLDGAAAGEGFEVREHRLVFYGICPACAGEKNPKGEQSRETGIKERS